jgi:2-aminoadipate transaminase
MSTFARRIAGLQPSAIRELLIHGSDPSVISFGGGFPDPALFPAEDLRAAFDEALSDPGNARLQYTVSDGLPALREQVAQRMTRAGTPCTVEDVLIIQGAQQGLDLVAKLMLDPGDVVITEAPTFLGALLAFNPYEPSYAPVAMDADGMDTDDLERVLTAHPETKLIYTVPDFQNPTGVTMTLERRRRLVELANRFDVLVIEDSPYRELRYSGEDVPTLKSLDTEDRVVHLGSFSKILAPGLRLGWTIAGPEITAKLALLKLAADTQCSTLNMAAVSIYLQRHDIDTHIKTLCTAYGSKRDLILSTIAAELPTDVRATRPDGGLFTWLSFPEGFDSARFMATKALPLAHVAYVPGATFFPTVQQPNHARVSFATLPEDKIIDGMTRLGSLLKAA